jgi:hypothetical protein
MNQAASGKSASKTVASSFSHASETRQVTRNVYVSFEVEHDSKEDNEYKTKPM